MRKFLLVVVLFYSLNAFADFGDLEQILQSNTNSVKNIISIIKTWALWIMGVAFLIYAGMTVLGGQDGGDKQKKMGTWFMSIGFVALAVVIVIQLFGL